MKELNINAGVLYGMLESGYHSLKNQEEILNNMNVFPVPDGDTGTNMCNTFYAVKSIDKTEAQALTLSDFCNLFSERTILYSRGNSGVILSSFFQGFSKGIRSEAAVNENPFIRGFQTGCQEAYASVINPTEGTILTIMRTCSDTVSGFQDAGEYSLKDLFRILVENSETALQDTPKQLEILNRAHVLDSGAFGFCLILKGMYLYLLNEPVELQNHSREEIVPNAGPAFDIRVSDTVLDGQYCTECIIQKTEFYQGEGRASALSSVLEQMGNSVDIIDSERILKFHLHTDHPGRAIEEALRFGDLLGVKVDNMKYQTEEQEKKRRKKAVKKYGFVAVSSGEGLRDRFFDLGVDNVVDGGQSMNPSTEEILAAVASSPGEIVFLFPNNKNVIPAAIQAKNMCDSRTVIVVETTNPLQAMMAILEFNPEDDADSNLENMVERIKLITTAEITKAVRESRTDDFKIEKDDYITILNGKIYHATVDPKQCFYSLKDHMKDSAFITVVRGKNAILTEEELTALIQENSKEAEIYIIDGGQPVYDYLLALE